MHHILTSSTGILAVQLGLLDDAARLFKEAGRFDYLNRLYQSAGIWNKAIKVRDTTSADDVVCLRVCLSVCLCVCVRESV